MKIKISTLKVIIWIVLYIILWLPYKNGIMRYTDEIITLICLINISFKIFKNKLLQKEEYLVLIFTGLLLLWGSISSMVAKIGQGTFPMMVDALSLMKVPITYIYFKYNFPQNYKEKFVKILFPISYFLIHISFICAVINLFIDIGMGYDIRFGIRSFQFLFNNPGPYAALMFVCYGILVICSNEKDKYIFTKIEACINILLTFRMGCIGPLGILLISYLFINKKIKIRDMIGGVCLVAIIGYKQFESYFLNETPRSQLVRGGIAIFKKYFPLGAGFASFGSDMAYKSYSPLYYELGYNYMWGFSPEIGHLINDNFWPMIIGQFGIMGLISYISLLSVQVLYLIKIKLSKERLCIAIGLFSLLIIGSLGSAILTSDLGMAIIIVYSLIVTT